MKVSLMGASKVVKSKKTEVVKKTPNPTYNESFQFKVPSSNTDMFSISLTVMQHAPAMKGKRFNGNDRQTDTLLSVIGSRAALC